MGSNPTLTAIIFLAPRNPNLEVMEVIGAGFQGLSPLLFGDGGASATVTHAHAKPPYGSPSGPPKEVVRSTSVVGGRDHGGAGADERRSI